jgi:alpha-beta hydrolase superfamily lysophospholipase
MDWITDELVREHHNVIQVKLPGHGTTPKDLDGIELKEFVNAVKRAIGEANLLTPTQVYVAGYSFGGALAIASSEDSTVQGGILFAPSFGPVPIVKTLLERKLKKVPANTLMDWSETGYKQITYEQADLLLARNIEMGSIALKKTLKAKFLLISGSKDNYADPSLVKAFCDSNNCELITFDAAHHDLLGSESFKATLSEKINAWSKNIRSTK